MPQTDKPVGQPLRRLGAELADFSVEFVPLLVAQLDGRPVAQPDGRLAAQPAALQVPPTVLCLPKAAFPQDVALVRAEAPRSDCVRDLSHLQLPVEGADALSHGFARD